MNQIALIFSDRIFITVADNRELLPNRCHFATQIAEDSVVKPFVWGLLLFPLVTSFFTPDTCGDSVCLSVQSIIPHTPDTLIFCENSYHKQYQSDTGVY